MLAKSRKACLRRGKGRRKKRKNARNDDALLYFSVSREIQS